LLNENNIEFDEKYFYGNESAAPSRGLFNRDSKFLGLRAAAQLFTPGYCSYSASGS